MRLYPNRKSRRQGRNLFTPLVLDTSYRRSILNFLKGAPRSFRRATVEEYENRDVKATFYVPGHAMKFTIEGDPERIYNFIANFWPDNLE